MRTKSYLSAREKNLSFLFAHFNLSQKWSSPQFKLIELYALLN